MGWLASLLVYLWVMARAIRQFRENRGLGIRFDWGKALATAGGCILVTLIALGCLFVGLDFDAPVAGAIGCVLVLIGGLVVLITAVNRHWPTPDVAPPAPLDRKGKTLLSAWTGIIVVAMACLIVLDINGHETAGLVVFFVMLGGGGLVLKRVASRRQPPIPPVGAP